MKHLLLFLLLLLASDMQAQRRRLKVGDTAQCGIVFHVAQDSSIIQRLLICALSDHEKAMQWYNGRYVTTSANADGLFRDANTRLIISAQGINTMYAALRTTSKPPSGNCPDTSGWYLPSKAELRLIYDSLAVKRKIKFAKEGYWSCVEDSTSRNPVRKAWIVDFLNGRSILNDKRNKFHVRAVKQITN